MPAPLKPLTNSVLGDLAVPHKSGNCYNGRKSNNRGKLTIMVVRQPRYSKEEFAQRGDLIYQTQIRPQVEAESI